MLETLKDRREEDDFEINILERTTSREQRNVSRHHGARQRLDGRHR